MTLLLLFFLFRVIMFNKAGGVWFEFRLIGIPWSGSKAQIRSAGNKKKHQAQRQTNKPLSATDLKWWHEVVIYCCSRMHPSLQMPLLKSQLSSLNWTKCRLIGTGVVAYEMATTIRREPRLTLLVKQQRWLNIYSAFLSERASVYGVLSTRIWRKTQREPPDKVRELITLGEVSKGDVKKEMVNGVVWSLQLAYCWNAT